MSLEAIRQFLIPRALIEQTLAPLQHAGRSGHEAFVLWGGERRGADTFEFQRAYVPKQTATRSSRGLLVVVDGAELFRVNRDFYRHGLILAGQIHSHPTAAYHSDTDDTYPLITLRGGLSGVVPDFGREGQRRMRDWAWYRLAGPADWQPLGADTRIALT